VIMHPHIVAMGFSHCGTIALNPPSVCSYLVTGWRISVLYSSDHRHCTVCGTSVRGSPEGKPRMKQLMSYDFICQVTGCSEVSTPGGQCLELHRQMVGEYGLLIWLPGVSLTQEEHGHRMADWRWTGRYKSVPVCDTLSACLIS